MKKLVASVFLWAFVGLFAFDVSAETRVDRLRSKIASGDRSYVFVTMHRGDWRNYPENSIDAILSCVRLGADVVELDVARTKDGHFVLSHDATIDRATTGKVRVEDLTLAELRQFKLREGSGGPDAPATKYDILTLEEALEATRGKILVNIDKFIFHPKQILDVVKAKGCLQNVIVKSDWPVATLRGMIGEEYWKMIQSGELIYMQILRYPKKAAIADEWFALEPRTNSVYECNFSDVASERIATTLQEKYPTVRIWMNTLWDSQSNGHSDAWGLKGEPEMGWGWCIDQGKATFIQTDAGKEVIDYLTKQKRREF